MQAYQIEKMHFGRFHYGKVKIHMVFDAKYDEIYAWLILKDIGFFTMEFSADFIVDQPDLQVGNIGVEVTRAVSRSNQPKISKMNEIGHLPPDEKRRVLERRDKKGFHKNYLVEEGVYPLDVISKNEQCEHIIKAIEDKNKKFLSYKKFETMGLFVNVESSMNIFSDVLDDFLEPNSYCDVIVIKTTDLIYKWENGIWAEYNALSAGYESIIHHARILRTQHFDKDGNKL